jgi:hypothetical protein
MQFRAVRAVLPIAFVISAVVPRSAWAQDVVVGSGQPSIDLTAKAAVARAVTETPQPEVAFSPAHNFPRFSPTLQSLYFTTALVQGLDAITTFRAMDHGAVEANSLVKPFASNRPAFLALKAGMATAFIYQGHEMSKRHKIGAIIALGLVNSAYATIVANNIHVIHAMQAQGR